MLRVKDIIVAFGSVEGTEAMSAVKALVKLNCSFTICEMPHEI